MTSGATAGRDRRATRTQDHHARRATRPWLAVCVAACLLIPRSLGAQPPSSRQAAAPPEAGFTARGRGELAVGGGAGDAVSILGSLDDHTLQVVNLTWTWALMRPGGPSVLRGQLHLGVEVVPLIAIQQGRTAFGAGGSPIFLKWLMHPVGRVTPFAEVLGGAIVTNRKVPEDITRFNYTAQGGLGVRVNLTSGRVISLSYRLHHVSNGGLGPRTRSRNSSVILAGVTVGGG